LPAFLLNQCGKSCRVAHHVGVVEETITRWRLSAEFLELAQFFVGVPVACTGETVQTEVLKLAGGGWGFQWVNDVDEIEFPAEFGDLFWFPRAARFPTEKKLAAFGALKKLFQAGDVISGRRETCGTLEEDEEGAKFLRDGKGFVPRPANGGVETEMTAVLPVVIVESGAFVGRTGGAMGDDLPRFERKLKIFRRGGAPTGGGLQARQLVESGINFDAGKFLKICGLGDGKTTTAGPDDWRFCSHAKLGRESFEQNLRVASTLLVFFPACRR